MVIEIGYSFLHLCKHQFASCNMYGDCQFPWRNMEWNSNTNCLQKLKGSLGTRVSHQPSAGYHFVTLLLHTRGRHLPMSIIWIPSHWAFLRLFLKFTFVFWYLILLMIILVKNNLKIFFKHTPWHVDLCFLTRDQTFTLCTGRRSLDHWLTREVPLL